MKYYLFPVDFQFKPLEFNTLSALDIYCRDNNICNCLINVSAKRARFLFNRWNKKYISRSYLRVFEGF